jgi:hypothetical protein
MIRIEVDSTVTTSRSGRTPKGKDWTMVEQRAYAHVLGEDGKPAKYPVGFKLTLDKDQPAYPVGMYSLDPRSVVVGDFDALGLDRVKLVPVAK